MHQEKNCIAMLSAFHRQKLNITLEWTARISVAYIVRKTLPSSDISSSTEWRGKNNKAFRDKYNHNCCIMLSIFFSLNLNRLSRYEHNFFKQPIVIFEKKKELRISFLKLSLCSHIEIHLFRGQVLVRPKIGANITMKTTQRCIFFCISMDIYKEPIVQFLYEVTSISVYTFSMCNSTIFNAFWFIEIDHARRFRFTNMFVFILFCMLSELLSKYFNSVFGVVSMIRLPEQKWHEILKWILACECYQMIYILTTKLIIVQEKEMKQSTIQF